MLIDANKWASMDADTLDRNLGLLYREQRKAYEQRERWRDSNTREGCALYSRWNDVYGRIERDINTIVQAYMAAQGGE